MQHNGDEVRVELSASCCSSAGGCDGGGGAVLCGCVSLKLAIELVSIVFAIPHRKRSEGLPIVDDPLRLNATHQRSAICSESAAPCAT